MSVTRKQRLSRASRLLLVVGTLFIAASTLSGTFVSVYIWKVDHSFSAIGIFNMCQYAALPIAFVLGGYSARYMGQLWLLRVGTGILAVFYAVLLALGEHSAHHVVWLGIMSGLGQGVYWLGYHVVTFDSTTPGTRGAFNGYAGLFASFVGMVGPFGSGFVIANSRIFSGYHVVFAVSLVLFAMLIVVSFMIPHTAPTHRLRLREGFRFSANEDWGSLWNASVVFGLREGLFSFYIGLLVYFVAKSEAGLGEYGLYTGLLSLASFYVAGRVSRRPRLATLLMRIAGVILGAVCISLLWEISRRSLLVFGTVTALSLPFLLVPFGAMIMNEIDESRRTAHFRMECLISREVALGIGRTASIGAYLVVVAIAPTVTAVVLLATVLGCSHAAVVLLLRHVTSRQRPPLHLARSTPVGRMSFRKIPRA